MRKITLTGRFKSRKEQAWQTTYPVEVLMAEEDEVLEFANIVRTAGGANVIDALMPSRPGAPSACLIANALNFNAVVDAVASAAEGDWTALPLSRRSLHWNMYFPLNLSPERIHKVGKATRCYVEANTSGGGTLYLPHHIGNAAHAFDSGDAYQEFITDYDF